MSLMVGDLNFVVQQVTGFIIKKSQRQVRGDGVIGKCVKQKNFIN